ncbi:RNA polymerase sigma factor [Stakelama tenebrarum]|uniref:Sigma-70 family RNA polymerase sigma factor n=1 Tax=Stakelama tenebrarum TaxID=2711215 RepID=A0A6G6Y2C9_9SPHN|nr:sigma-70 family RNA polymerase sigma factor [Sphingosinithalassobacter tenebrarum]QIG79104.1 sigma-70 family RNA polymerase sigma factor [Sphingosinithalassobacter tenebrarum]
MDAQRTPCEHRDSLYRQACESHAPALARLARSVEFDAERASDLEQDIHLALWRSFAQFDGRCSLATWVYRVAHNVAAGHKARGARGAKLIALEEAETLVADDDPEAAVDTSRTLVRLRRLIAGLKPTDRSVILLWLEGLDAAEIGEVTGLAPGNVAVKTHRIKALLARNFAQGEAG